MPDVGVRSEVILSIYIVSFLIGLPNNILALYVFSIKIHNKPALTDILLVNLTISDLLFLFFLPLKMHEAASGMLWNLPSIFCSITSFIFFSTIYTSSLLLTAVSVVRYICVAFPITYRRLQKPIHAVVVSAVIWVISLGHCTITIVISDDPTLSNGDSPVCYENFTKAQLAILLPVRLEFFTVLCVLPLLVCIFCYVNCIWILYRQPRINREKTRKAIGMAVGTMAVFLVCVIPYNVSHVVGYIQDSSPQWRYYTLLLSTFNTCLDPIIFFFSSSAIRVTTKNTVLKLIGRRSALQSGGINMVQESQLSG